MAVRITRDEDGNWVIPDDVCHYVAVAEFYGFDQEIPCGADAAFLVKYELFVPYDYETNETDKWVYADEIVCSTHRDEMVSYALTHPDEMRNLVETDIRENPDALAQNVAEANNNDFWYEWYQNLPKSPEASPDTHLHSDWVKSGGWGKSDIRGYKEWIGNTGL